MAEVGDGHAVSYELGPKRHGWLHVIEGAVTVNGTKLQTGDAAALTHEERLSVHGSGAEKSEVLLFDLA